MDRADTEHSAPRKICGWCFSRVCFIKVEEGCPGNLRMRSKARRNMQGGFMAHQL